MQRSMLYLIPVALAAAFAAGVPLAQDRSGASGRKPAASTTSADEEAVRKQAAEFSAERFTQRMGDWIDDVAGGVW